MIPTRYRWQDPCFVGGQEEKNEMRFSKAVLGFVGFVTFGAASAFAQVEVPSQVSIQGTALITKSTKNTTPTNDVIKTGGFLLGYSYQFNSWAGVEGNYGYTRNTN